MSSPRLDTSLHLLHQLVPFRRLIVRAVSVGAPRALGAALTFGAQVLLARWMGADQLGMYVLVFALCTVVALACGLGLPSAAPRFVAEALARKEPRLLCGFIIRSRQITIGAATA